MRPNASPTTVWRWAAKMYGPERIFRDAKITTQQEQITLTSTPFLFSTGGPQGGLFSEKLMSDQRTTNTNPIKITFATQLGYRPFEIPRQ